MVSVRNEFYIDQFEIEQERRKINEALNVGLLSQFKIQNLRCFFT